MRLQILALLLAAAAQTSGPGRTLFEGARLIVGDGRQPIENSAFLVENDTITRVGRKGEIQPPGGTMRVDLPGVSTQKPAWLDDPVLAERLGRIEPRMSADFIVLDANPLENISNTRRISQVYQRGNALDRAAMRAAWATGR